MPQSGMHRIPLIAGPLRLLLPCSALLQVRNNLIEANNRMRQLLRVFGDCSLQRPGALQLAPHVQAALIPETRHTPMFKLPGQGSRLVFCQVGIECPNLPLRSSYSNALFLIGWFVGC